MHFAFGRVRRKIARLRTGVFMPASVEILNVPIGSVLTSSIGVNDEADKNDFTVLLLWGENVDLTQSGISVSAGSSIVAFEGANSVYMVRVRPSQTETGTVTVTVVANAVSEGNAQTSKDIRISTSFPDADAEIPTQFFSLTGITSGYSPHGIAITPTRILIATGRQYDLGCTVQKYTFDGTRIASEDISITNRGPHTIDYINGDLFFQGYTSSVVLYSARYKFR